MDNQISSAMTGGVTLSATALSPLVTWALNGFQHPIPDTIPLLISSVIITVSHFLFNYFTRKQNEPAKEIKPPSSGTIG